MLGEVRMGRPTDGPQHSRTLAIATAGKNRSGIARGQLIEAKQAMTNTD
jgi:hypothetical protein